FELSELPERLLIVGGGPIGCEMAQAFRRLGSEVAIVEMSDRLLPRDDPKATAVLQSALKAEGVELILGSKVDRVEMSGSKISCHITTPIGASTYMASHILLATGRTPNTAGLSLERAG